MGASLGDPKRSVSVVRFMGTLIECMCICFCAVYFLKKYSDSKCCWKKYSDFGGGKNK